MRKPFPAADWQQWPKAVRIALRSARTRLADRGSLSPELVATALYRSIFDREPDLGGLRHTVNRLRSGAALEDVVRTFIVSPEFRQRMLKAAVPDIDLPYDAFGVWSPVIDLDKEITAAIVRGLGARSCFELGCFTGPVLSLLAEAGIKVAGAEVSHTAFTFAYPNIREGMLYGDMLGLDIDGRFDVVLCLDVLEHIAPLELDRYVERVTSLLTEDGFVFVNAPMYGDDPTFGAVFGAYLNEWHTVGESTFWRHWPCDDKGWPEHGHLVWARVEWWSRMFEAHGLVRDSVIERVVHHHLANFFENTPARRAFFVLRRRQNSRSAMAAAELDAALARMPNLPRPHA